MFYDINKLNRCERINMKTKNFPERQNIRRKAALQRFLNPKEIKNPDNPEARDIMIENTKWKIMDNMRDVKTKKDRGKR